MLMHKTKNYILKMKKLLYWPESKKKTFDKFCNFEKNVFLLEKQIQTFFIFFVKKMDVARHDKV